MNIQQAHGQFLRECRDGTLLRRSDDTIANYKSSFRLFLQSIPITQVSELHESLLRQFFNRGEAKRGWQPRTIMTHRKNLNAFFKWCVSKGLLTKSPLDEIPHPRVLRKLPDFYSEEEIDRILYHVEMKAYSSFEKVRNKAIFAVFCLAGLRRGELINLKISDVDFVEEIIRVRAETAKDREPRVIRMNYKLKEILEDYWRARNQRGVETTFFWVSSTYPMRFTVYGLSHLVKKLSKQLGIRIKSHKMRHTFATKFYQGSQDIISLKQILGHQDVNTTMIYAHVTAEHTKNSLNKNPLNAVF